MHAKVFSIQIYKFPPNSAKGLHFSAFHLKGNYFINLYGTFVNVYDSTYDLYFQFSIDCGLFSFKKQNVFII